MGSSGRLFLKLLRESKTVGSVMYSIAICNAIQIRGSSLASEERGQWGSIKREAPPHLLQKTDSEQVTHPNQAFPPTSVSVVLLLGVIRALLKSPLPGEALP